MPSSIPPSSPPWTTGPSPMMQQQHNGYQYNGGSSSSSSRGLSNDGAGGAGSYGDSPFHTNGNNNNVNGQSPYGAGGPGTYLPSLNTNGVGSGGFGSYYASPTSYQSAPHQQQQYQNANANGYALPGPGPSSAAMFYRQSTTGGVDTGSGGGGGLGCLNGNSSKPGHYSGGSNGFTDLHSERRTSASAAAAAAAVLEGMVSGGGGTGSGTGGRGTPTARSASTPDDNNHHQLHHASSQPKKKQKKNPTSTSKTAADVNGGGTSAGMTQKEKDEESRRKTARACDVCRTKKIRCDIIIMPAAEGEEGNTAYPQGLCAHCKQAGSECTFFMPITETRFKKKLAAEAAEAAGTGSESGGAAPSQSVAKEKDVSSARKKERKSQAKAAPPALTAAAEAPSPITITVPHLRAGQSGQPVRDRAGRIEGPTSISFLLHSTAALPRTSVEDFDLRNHQTWQMVSDDGDGVIRVFNPPASASFKHSSGEYQDGDDPSRNPSSGIDHRPVLSAQLISNLINSYFDNVAPLFPVVTKNDFIREGNPPPLLLYAMAGVASASRGVSGEVFNAIRGIINGIIRTNDILSDASMSHVQALLVLTLVGDLHAQPVATAVSATITRVSTAVRMAQLLGLHRESDASSESPEEMASIEMRRRVWAGCVIMDRWCGVTLGLPLMIDITDCDCLLLSPYELLPGKGVQWDVLGPQPYSHLAEHLKLVILLGRVMKLIYSPIGLSQTSDDQLEALIADVEAWRAGLPSHLQYVGTQSSSGAGLLHMSHCALQFLFWRPFMRLSYSLPAHLKRIAMTVERWTALVQWSRESIDWLERNEESLDHVFIVPYTITNCALIQYHTWIRRRDPESLASLEKIKKTVTRWETAVRPDHMSMRRKTVEVMSLLYEAAKKAHAPENNEENTYALNPTTGVRRRDKSMFKNVVWQKDESRPGRGVFVATNKVLETEMPKDIPEGLVIVAPAKQSQPEDTSEGAAAAEPPPAPNANLNPALNAASVNGGASDPMLLNMLDGTAANQSLEQAAMMDQTLLDGLPTGFDWAAWNEYFDRFGFPNMDGGGGLIGGGGTPATGQQQIGGFSF